MSKFKYSLLAASVTLCFASQAGAASPTYDLGVVTVDGVTTPVEDLSSGFTLDHTGKDISIKATGKYENSTSGKRAIWLTTNQTGTIKGQNLVVDSEFGRGIQAGNGAKINIDVAGDTVVSAKGDVGLFVAGAGSSLSIKTGTLTLNMDKSSTFGIHVQNNSQTPEAPDNTAFVKVKADTITINGGEIGVSAYSNGKIDLTGDLTVTAKHAIEARGNSTININQDGKHKTVLTGDIVFGTPATSDDSQNSGNLIDADVNINLVGTDSVWTGRAFKQCGTFETIDSDMEDFYGDVSGFNVQLSDNASWQMTGDSFVNTLGVKDGSTVVVNKAVTKLNADTVNLSGGSFDVQGNAALNVDALEGTGGTVSLAATLNDNQTIESGTLTVNQAGNVKLDVSVTGFTADDVVDAEATMDSLDNKIVVTGNSELSKTNTIAEGDINGAISQTVDKDGNKGEIHQEVNQKLDGYSSIAALSAVQWRHENDTLLKRMGELRDADGTVGAWARIYGSEQEYGAQSVNAKNTTVQVGADYDVGAGWKVGGAFSYTDGSSTFDMGESDSDMYGVSVYGTWLADNGQFVDLIAKYSRLSNEFTSGTMKGDFDNNAFSVAAEYGWHFAMNDLAFVEPSAGVTYGRIMGDDFVAHNGVRVEQDDYDSLIGRLGVRSGFYFPEQKGSIYARVAVLHDFMGDMESTASKDGNVAYLKDELGDTWVEYGIGANFNLTNTTYSFVDLEKTTGSDVKENWRWNIGLRTVF